MATAIVTTKCALSALLCFCMSKYGKLPAKRLRLILLDYYQAEDITVAKKKLLTDAELVWTATESLPRYPERNGDHRTARELDDIFDILNKLDERQLLRELPRYVTDSTDNIPSLKLEDGDLRYIIAKMDKMEATIQGLLATVNTVYSLVAAIKPGALATHESTGGQCLTRSDNVEPRRDKQPSTRVSRSVADCTHTILPVGNPNMKTISFMNENKGVTKVADNEYSGSLARSNRWSSLVSGTSTGDNSTHESSDEYELVGSKRRRRRHAKLSSKENTPQAGSYSSAVRSNPTGHNAVKSGISADVNKPTRHGTRHGNKTLIIGKGTAASHTVSGGSSHLAAARQFKALFCVDNVNISVEINELVEFVSSLGVRVLSCFKVKPRLSMFQRTNGIEPAHSTFRLCINRGDTKQLLQAHLWPSDILISEWFFSKQVRSSNDKQISGSNIVVSDPPADDVAKVVDNAIKTLRGNAAELGLLNESPVDMEATILLNAATCNSPAASDGCVRVNLDSTRIDYNGGKTSSN